MGNRQIYAGFVFIHSVINLLEITLNELLAGEYIPEEELREKTDKVLMEVIANWLGHDKWELKEKDVTIKMC
ncbi:MAG: hypothetical protein ACI4D5_07600 [Kineothrix sp.]